MARLFRSYLALALSLLLVLTGQSFAASRGMSAAVGQMEICTGTGPVIVYFDEDGQPASPPHFCPDYALALLGAVLPDQPPLPVAPKHDRPAPLRAADLGAPQLHLHAAARAPPSAV